MFASNPITPIPSFDRESQKDRKSLKTEVKPFSRILKIRARTRQLVAISVTNPEVAECYLSKLDTPEGLYLEESAVSIHDGVCHAIAINTTESNIDIEIAPQDLIPFDFCQFPGKVLFDSEPKYSIPGSRGYLSSYAQRVERVKKSLHLSHFNDKDKNYFFRWADDYADIFHLNGERFSSTHLIQHRFRTSDNEMIAKKQYPHDATDQVILQTERQYNNGIIGDSKSAYNSPLWIVPKKLDASGEKKWRVVIDFRALNEKANGDAYPCLTSLVF